MSTSRENRLVEEETDSDNKDEEEQTHTYNIGLKNYRWDFNIKVQMHAYNQTWFRVPELMRAITGIRRLNLSKSSGRNVALASLDAVSKTLKDIGVRYDARFPQSLHVICEDIGVWSNYFVKLRSNLNAPDRSTYQKYKECKRHIQQSNLLYEILEEMVQVLNDLNSSMNQESFEKFFNLTWFE